MGRLLFPREAKARRVAKIKSRSYRKVHKKASKARAEAEEALDKHSAQRMQMKREVERVRERMTLKHKNTCAGPETLPRHSQDSVETL